MAKQLTLHFGASTESRPGVRLRRERSWPTGAMAPEAAKTIAAEVAECVATGLGTGIRLSEIVVTANKRRYLRVSRRNGAWVASVHWRLLAEPQRLAAILVFALLEGRLPLDARDWIASLSPAASDHTYSESRASGGRCSPDLRSRLERVAAYSIAPARAGEVRIIWGRSPRRRKRKRSVRLGRLVLADRKITIHPVLSGASVPEIVLDSVIFHEFSHWLFPPLSTKEARERCDHRIHHREFREHEARYPHLDEAESWISTNLDLLLCH